MISIAITTYNRYNSTCKVIESFLDDPRVDEIIVSDDASTDGSFLKLMQTFRPYDKVVLSQQFRNRNMSFNKYSAVSMCKNEFALLADSDNEFDRTYLDAFDYIGDWHQDTIYCPSWAKETFDYREFEGVVLDRNNVKNFMDKPLFRCMLNTANYIVPVEGYSKIFKEYDGIGAADTIWMNYLWLKSGYMFYVVPNMHYIHTQHAGSGFLQDVQGNMQRAKEIENLIMAL